MMDDEWTRRSLDRQEAVRELAAEVTVSRMLIEAMERAVQIRHDDADLYPEFRRDPLEPIREALAQVSERGETWRAIYLPATEKEH